MSCVTLKYPDLTDTIKAAVNLSVVSAENTDELMGNIPAAVLTFWHIFRLK